MRNRIITIGIAIALAAGYTACKKEDTKPVTTTQYSSPYPVTAGKWTVAKYEMNGVEHTDFYTPYQFVFKSDGSVEVEGASGIKGTWSMKPVLGVESMQLDLGDQEPFNFLKSDSWKIISKTATRIEMTGTRGDDGKHSLTIQRL
jgi:hypothetical protein